MDLTTEMIAPLTDIVTNNQVMLFTIVFTVLSFYLLIKLVRKVAR